LLTTIRDGTQAPNPRVLLDDCKDDVALEASFVGELKGRVADLLRSSF